MNTRTSASFRPSRAEFCFGRFRLHPEGGLFRGEVAVDLPPAELAALRLLAAHAGQIVTPAQLRKTLWGDAPAAAGRVSKCIDSLRARLAPEDCIETVYKRGYRLSYAVSTIHAEADPPGVMAPTAIKRLAIMPFAARLGAPEHLAFAVAEETGIRLKSAIPPVVEVLAPDSVFALARRGHSPLEAGRMLEADLVLTASLSALPFGYRVRAEMFSVHDECQLWVEDMLVEKDQQAGVETELSRRVAFRLHGRGVSISASAAEEADGPQFREAYELYRRARFDWQSLLRRPMQDALNGLLRAVELGPGLTALRVDLVNLCLAQSLYGYMPAVAAAGMARRAAEGLLHAGFLADGDGPARDVDPRAEALLPALGWFAFHVDRNLPAAVRAFDLSAHLPPYRWTTCARSMFALSRHRFGEAIEMLRGELWNDPYSPWLQARLGWALHLAGDASGSARQIKNAYAQFPDDADVSLYAASILAYNDEAGRAAQIAEELSQRRPDFDLAAGAHAYALARAGRAEEAREALERLEWLSRERFVLNPFTAAVYLALGEPDAALAQLQASNEARCPWFFQMLGDPRLSGLHGQAKFAELQAILPAMEAAAREQSAK